VVWWFGRGCRGCLEEGERAAFDVSWDDKNDRDHHDTTAAMQRLIDAPTLAWATEPSSSPTCCVDAARVAQGPVLKPQRAGLERDVGALFKYKQAKERCDSGCQGFIIILICTSPLIPKPS